MTGVLIDWPYFTYCASWIRRRSCRAVVLRTPVYIWKRIARYTHFIFFWLSLEISEGSLFYHQHQISVLSVTPRWKMRPNTQGTVDGKEDFISLGISSHQVVWIRLIKHKKAMNLPLNPPLLWFFFAVGGHCKASNSGSVRQHLTK